MDKTARVDAHCHFFNLWYLISELLTMGHDAIFGGYPRDRQMSFGAGAGAGLDFSHKDQLKKSIDSLIRQIVQAAGSAFNSYEENYLLLRKNYLAGHQDASDLSVFPLMMDIYYMFDGYFGAPKASGITSVREGGEAEEEFEKWFAAEKEVITEGIERRRLDAFSTYRNLIDDPELFRLEEAFSTLQGELTAGGAVLRNGLGLSGTMPATMTPGFEKEIRDSLALQSKYPETVFPFFAVDPRRAGIVSLVKGSDIFTGQDRPLVSRSGPFYGIKLYPRLGYLPTAAELTELFQWCADNCIPITFHCGTRGFPDLPGWKWSKNSDPALWKDILGNYKDNNGGLRVDFAHFGEESQIWRQNICDYATNKGGAYGGNVYSDVACYVKESSLENAKATCDKNAGMSEKLMFGTDFDVMLLTGHVDIQEYFKNFERVFHGTGSQPDTETMMRTVPRAFLNAVCEGGSAGGGSSRKVMSGGGGRDELPGHRLGKEIKLGWLRDPPDVRDFTIFTVRVSSRLLELNRKTTVRAMVAPLFFKKGKKLPKTVDLRAWCSPVEDQKNLGSCTANAAVGLVEYFERRATGRYIDASRLFLYKVTRKLLGWNGDTGAFLRTAMEALVLFGTPPEERFPYDVESFDEEPEPFAYAFAQNYKTISYFRLDPVGTRPEELLLAIKTALAGGYPSVFGFSVYDSMGEAEKNGGKVPFPAMRDKLRGGHAVMAVGYDDDLVISGSAIGSTPTRGALLFRNSWGEDWGDGGYGWLPYEYMLEGLAVDWWSIVKQEWVDTESFK